MINTLALDKALTLYISIILLFFAHTTSQAAQKYPIGTNLNGIKDWSSQFPFIDLTKQSRKWIPQKRGLPWGKGGSLNLDNHGWVKNLKHNQYADLIIITTRKDLPIPFRKLIVFYEGRGKLEFRGTLKKIASPNARSYQVEVTNKRFGPGIIRILKTDPNNPIRNIKVIPTKLLTNYQRGEIFNPLWLDYIKNFRTIRYMDWMETNGSEISSWSDRPKLSDYTWSIKGVPIEIILELSKQTETDIWLNIPHKADDDYIQNLAKFIKTHKPVSTKLYLEHSNEVWNWRFPQTRYAHQMAEKLWGKHGNGFIQWHGMRSAQICDTWKAIFDNRKDEIICVMGIHPGWTGLEKLVLECPLWAKTSGKPCYKYGIDAIAITGYFTGCLDGVAGWKLPQQVQTIRKWFNDSDGGMQKAYEQTLTGKYFQCRKTLPEIKEKYQYFRNAADDYGLHLYAYEGGQHITGNGQKIQNDNAFIEFHMKFNRTDYMRLLTLKNFQNWKDAGGELFMYFTDIHPPSKYGSWGSMDHLFDGDSPKAKAIKEFSKSSECWWSDCKRD